MNLALLLLSLSAVAAAGLAFTRRNLIHAALLLIVTWGSVAGVYLWAGAEFVAFAQVLIYVGAVSMVVLFAVLLTRPGGVTFAVEAEAETDSRKNFVRAATAILVGCAVAGVLVGAVVNTSFPAVGTTAPEVNVRQLGFQLLNRHAASLLILGVILTAALIGATVLASTDKPAAADGDVVPLPPPNVPRAGEAGSEDAP